MESVEKEKAVLFSGIEAEARAEAEKIIKEAESQAAEKRKYSEKKIKSLLNDAREQAQERAEAVKRKILSGAELEVKRRSMRIRDRIMQDILERVEKKLSSMTGNPDYRSVLVNWITEAACGLDAESAVVNASEGERTLINDQLLSEVSEKMQKQTGKQVTLILSDEQPLKYHGIILTASNGRTAFNNQVKTRMLRSQRKIRMLIYNTLFTDQKE